MSFTLGGMIRRGGQFGTDKDLYGTKPKIPDYPEIEKAQEAAVKANKERLPDIMDLARQVDTFNQEEILRMLKGSGLDTDAISSQINSQLRGEISSQTAGEVSRKAAERALAGGFAGSGMSRNLTLRDFGITSMMNFERGLNSAQRWASMAAAPQYDVTSMFLSPAQKFAAMEAKFQRDLMAANVRAAPDPAKRGAYDTEMAIIGMVLSVYGGGAGYTNAHKPNYGGVQSSGVGGTGGSYVPRNNVTPQADPGWRFEYGNGQTASTGGGGKENTAKAMKTFGFF